MRKSKKSRGTVQIPHLLEREQRTKETVQGASQENAPEPEDMSLQLENMWSGQYR